MCVQRTCFSGRIDAPFCMDNSRTFFASLSRQVRQEVIRKTSDDPQCERWRAEIARSRLRLLMDSNGPFAGDMVGFFTSLNFFTERDYTSGACVTTDIKELFLVTNDEAGMDFESSLGRTLVSFRYEGY